MARASECACMRMQELFMQSGVRCPSPMRAPHSRHQSATVAPSLRGHVMSLASPVRAGAIRLAQLGPAGSFDYGRRQVLPDTFCWRCSATMHTAVRHALVHRGLLCNWCAVASAVGGREGGGRGETQSESSVPKLGKSSRYFRHVCTHGCVPYPQSFPCCGGAKGHTERHAR